MAESIGTHPDLAYKAQVDAIADKQDGDVYVYPSLVELGESDVWHPVIHGEGENTLDLGGQFAPNTVAIKELAGRTNNLKATLTEIGNVGKQFLIDNTGVTIDFLSAEAKACNPHFDGDYLESNGRLVLSNHLTSGLAPIDPNDPTKTQWFAIASLNQEPVDNAICKVDGSFFSNEAGYYETPFAYTNNVSRTSIEVVVLRSYRQGNAQYRVTPNSTNPFANVHEYVENRVARIYDENKNDNTYIKAIKFFDQWNGAVRDHYIKTVHQDYNGWMSSTSWQPAVMYARFVNVSATGTTSCTAPRTCRDEDNPNYVRGGMPLQNIADFHSYAFISNVSGIYKYRKVMKELTNG